MNQALGRYENPRHFPVWQNHIALNRIASASMKERSAVKGDLFAAEHHGKKIDALGDPLGEIESRTGLVALAAEVNDAAPHPVSAQGGHPRYPTETMWYGFWS